MSRGAHLIRTSRGVVGALSCALLLAATGCGRSSEDSGACGALIEALPSKVADQASSGSATWGDPKIRLTCGVGTPDGLTATSRCSETDGVDWYVPEDQQGSSPVDTTLTTVGRSPRVEVRVPKDYWPPVSVQSDLAAAIRAHTKQTSPCV